MGEKKHKGYNLLTKRLLEKGYTADCYPDYVRIDTIRGQEKSLDNPYGGFTFERWWVFERVFKTPCGLQCKGLRCHSHLHLEGVDWTYENDMATIRCPYEKKDCSLKHRALRMPGAPRFECDVHMVEEEYRYEGSIESIFQLYDDKIRRARISSQLQKRGRICRFYTASGRGLEEGEVEYNPYDCGQQRCMGMCPVLGRELDKL